MNIKLIAAFIVLSILTGPVCGQNNARPLTAAQRQYVTNHGHKLASQNRATVKTAHLSLSQRKQIFWQLGIIEGRVYDETKNVAPLQEGAVSDLLTDKYRNRLAKQYHITRKQVEAIEFEGGTHHWPSPEGPN